MIPPQANHCILFVHTTLVSSTRCPLVLQGGVAISSFSLPPLLQRTVAKHSRQCPLSLVRSQSEADELKFSFLCSLSYVCACVCMSCWLDRPRSGGRGKVLHAAILLAVSFKCQSQCTPKFQLSCSIYSLCC